MSFLDHLAEQIDFERYGGRARVEAALEDGEELHYAAPGWLEEASSAPGGGGKKEEGLLLLSDRRVLIIRSPGLFRKNPKPVSLPFSTMTNAGQHKTAPSAVVVAHDDHGLLRGHYLIFAGDSGDALATIWGNEIRDRAIST